MKDLPLFIALIIIALLAFVAEAQVIQPAIKGLATFYTVESCQKEGTSGVFTASGERYDESKLTCAMRSRKWGSRFKVTNIDNGKSIICKLNDFGPGMKATKRGVIIDLSPASFDALGGRRGKSWGEINVEVEALRRNHDQ